MKAADFLDLKNPWQHRRRVLGFFEDIGGVLREYHQSQRVI